MKKFILGIAFVAMVFGLITTVSAAVEYTPVQKDGTWQPKNDPNDPRHGTMTCVSIILWSNCNPIGSTDTY